jgi:uncharacterized protein YjbJ (UPF0337 family)
MNGRLFRVAFSFENITHIKNIMENLKVNWNEAKRKLKHKFIVLTDSDLLFVNGKQDELLGRLQKKLGKTREEIIKIISGS